MKSLLERASGWKDPKRVERELMKAMGVSACQFKFSDKDRWVRLTSVGRLMEIEAFFVSACREEMNLVAGLLPMETVGTND